MSALGLYSDNGIMDAGRLVPRSEMKAVRYNHKFEGKPVRSKHYCHQNHIGKEICSRTPRWTVLKVAVYNLKQNAKGEMTQSVPLDISMVSRVVRNWVLSQPQY